MARIRSIKPGCFTSEDVAALTLRERWLWVGLWTHADDHGRAKDNPKLILAAVWALDDVSLADVCADLDALHQKGRIARYEAGGAPFLAIVGWHDHQAINRPQESKFPPPPADLHPRVCAHGAITERAVNAPVALPSGGEGKGGEQGGDARSADEPPTRCLRHLNSNDDAPCRPCGDARRAHDRWVRAQRSKPTPIPGPGGAPRCEEHPQEAARTCRSCAADRKAAAS